MSCDVAWIMRPKRVRIRNHHCAASSTAVVAKMNTTCLEMPTSPSFHCAEPKGEGTDCGSGPKMISTRFSSTMPTAMVVRITR